MPGSPGRVRRLILSGGVAHPPLALAVQRAISTVLPLAVLARIAGAQQGPDGAADMRSVGKAAHHSRRRTPVEPRAARGVHRAAARGPGHRGAVDTVYAIV
ncbi:hypothetical protein [Dactylosporangium sp. NPDC049140]|uniref:hypothetical protein n=1 Tax=Dactylosporangium sp. NPDC049140 TaxID=3155647 RepID=UPI00340ECE2D